MKIILHIITGLSRGGAETMLYKLLAHLKQNNKYRHVVLCLFGGSDFDFLSLNIPVYFGNISRGIPSVGEIVKLRHLVSTINPDLIHGWMYHSNLASSVLAKSEIPIIWSIHHSLHDFSNEKMLTKSIIFGCRFLSHSSSIKRIIYVSSRSMNQHEQFGFCVAKSLRIPIGFDCDIYTPNKISRDRNRSKLHYSDEHFLIGIAARYHPVKNHIGLIKAFSRIHAKLPQARLIMAGTGMVESNIELLNVINQNNLRSFICLLGEENDMAGFFSLLDLNVLYSNSEGFPNVLGESMACGTLCVSTNVGDAAEIIYNTGVVVPVGDINSFVSAVIGIANEDISTKRIKSKAARDRIQGSFSLSLISQQYLSVYDSIVNSRQLIYQS